MAFGFPLTVGPRDKKGARRVARSLGAIRNAAPPMVSRANRLHWAVAAAAAVIGTGCCDDHIRAASTSFVPNLWLGTSYAWVGDTAGLYAAALSDPGNSAIWCTGVVYTSIEQPGRFQYASTNPAVAFIDERARFVALQAGVTGVVTTTGGVMDTMHVIVGPAIASLRISATPLPARVGDTISVQLDALDHGGAAIGGAEVQLLDFALGSDSLARWIRTSRVPRPFPSYTFQSPLSDRLVLLRSGVLRIVASAPHDVGEPPRYIADTLTLTTTVR